jgi:NAD+ synthase (glutamine-hydrolysing)
MKIGLAQLNPTIGDLAGNAQQILLAAQSALAQGVDVLLTPELSLCGYPPRDLLLNPSFITAIARTLDQLAQDLPPQLTVLIGAALTNPQSEQHGGKPLSNCVVLVHQGKIRQTFYKRLLPTYDVFDEDRYFEPGSQANVFGLSKQGRWLEPTDSQNAGIKVGVTICEDIWNDEQFWGKRSYAINPLTALAEQDVDLIVNLSASPYRSGKQYLRQAMLKHAASQYDRPIVYVNQVGGNDDLIFDGNSVALNRKGKVCCRAHAFDPDLVIVDFDPSTGDIVPTVQRHKPSCEAAELWTALVLGVRDYARKCGFKQAVIGLSGGIDSTLVAAIATQALGSANVLGVLMPSPYSSDHSIQDALALAETLGIQTHTLPIGALMQNYDHVLSDVFVGTTADVTEENLQSRIRGNLLMAIANKFGHLLLSTGNKSEMAVGYCTLYGDMNGGLAAIADVPKTRVYAICEWLNSDLQKTGSSFDWQSCSQLGIKANNPAACVIPPNVLVKPPSAELKPGQMDQDSLPPYDILDDILRRIIHEHQSLTEIVDAGYESDVVSRIWDGLADADRKSLARLNQFLFLC